MAKVRSLAVAALLLLAHSGSRAEAPADSSRAPREETCQELVERIKASDCAKPVARFLQGAMVYVGIAFNSSRLHIDSEDTALASLVGIFSPSPAFGFSLPTRYFGGSRLGYTASLTYASSVTLYQDLRRDQDKVRDLGSYSSITFLSLSPSVFLSLGARDEDPDVYFRTGLGGGIGWASVRGVAYHTQEGSGPRRSCFDAADSLARGVITRGGFRSLCEPRAFKVRGLGLSTAFFMDFRWAFLYGRFSVGAMRVTSGRHLYEPTEASIRLAYVHDL